LTTTALASVGAFAFASHAMAAGMNKPTLTISGWDEQIIGFAFNNRPDNYTSHGNGFDVQTDSEIHFSGSATLDNGIKVGFRVEMEGNTSSDMIDENWMRVSGSFGQVQAGSTDNAAQQMTTGYLGAWSTGVGQNLAFDVADWIESTNSVSTVWRTQATRNTDTEKLNYFTPRFAGFQLGAAYIPGGSQDVNNTPASRAGTEHSGYAIGANFVRKFGDIGLGIAAGYGGAKTNIQTADDRKTWGAGIKVDFAGFRVAFGYVGLKQPVAGGNRKGHDFDAGIRYTFGPNAISLTGQAIKQETTNGANEAKTQQAMLSYRRTLGPGVNWMVQGMWANYSGVDTSTTSLSNKGYAVTSSVKVNF
jgi:hypothetical protein